MTEESARKEAEHTRRISGLFSDIAASYDFLNRLLSLRRDVAWRRAAARLMRFSVTNRYLDVASGTADLAIEVVRQHAGVSALGVDPVEDLMRIGRGKVARMGLTDRIRLIEGNALALDVADGEFDVAGIAFGIRNIKDKHGALSEMRRAVAPGGMVVVLELTFAPRPPFRWLYDLYLNRMLPLIGRLFSKDPKAYRYLAASIMGFPSPKEFVRVMEGAGLRDCRAVPLTLGVAHVFVGIR